MSQLVHESKPPSVNTERGGLLDKYERLLSRCQPYAILNRHVRQHCNLKPLGLELETLMSPFNRRSGPFLDAVQWLDRMTFGFAGMAMPRWALYDCSEIPGGICGFSMPIETLPRSVFHGDEMAAYRGPMPVSMAISIPMVPEGAWLKHTLSSINELTHLAAPPGLRTITFAMALSLFQVKVLYAALQWRSSELRVHTKFGDLELVTAYTPAHTEPRTLTYRLPITEESIARGLSGAFAYAPVPRQAFWLDVDDIEGLIQLQRDLEAGRRVSVCGRPVRDGSQTWVPLREGAND